MKSEKRCLITGCNTGIGKQIAKELAKKGYEILMLVRDSEKSRNAFEEIKTVSISKKVSLFTVDFASLNSVREAARKIKSEVNAIDILINNAGVFTKKMRNSEEDLEYMFAVNYLAPFLLTNMLLPVLKKGTNTRIINMSSMLYKRGFINLKNIKGPKIYNSDKIYASTKRMINLFTLTLASKVEKNGITVNAVYPGVVASNIMRDYSKLMQKFTFLFSTSIEKGAESPIYLATSPELEGITGKFYNKTKPVAGALGDAKFASKLWKKTEELLVTLQEKKDDTDDLGF